MLMQAFDTFIGLVSVFLILSLIVSALGEGVSSALSFKGKTLKRSIATLLDTRTADAFFEHESIIRLRKERPFFGPRLPAYIPDTLIAEVIVDLVVNPPVAGAKSEENEKGVLDRLMGLIGLGSSQEAEGEGDANEAAEDDKAPLSPNAVNRAVTDCKKPYGPALRKLWREAECDVEQFKVRIAGWFNLTGDRSVGWFRRKLSFSLFLIGLFVAAFLNADTLYMFNVLSNDASLRESFVEYATNVVDEAKQAEIPCEDEACRQMVRDFADGGAATDEAKLQALCNQADAFDEASCRADLKARLEVEGQACRALGVEDECSLSALIGSALPEVTPLLGADLLSEQFDEFANKCPDDGATKCGFFGFSSGEWSFFALKLIGWMITAAAVSLGAPFWFDLLQKIVQVRSSVKPTASAPAGSPASEKAVATTAPVPTARAVIRKTATDVAALESLGKFDAKIYGYSPLNIFWSARLSKLAYVTEKALIEAELEDWGAEGELLDWEDSQCIVAHTPRAAFLSFRGTEGIAADWVTDANIPMKPPAWDANAGYEVHTGFDKGLDVIWDDHKKGDTRFTGIHKTLEKMRVFEQKVPIWLSGHSLGGALAALASLRLEKFLADQGHGNIVAGIHTFGQPRVGDAACVDAIEKRFPSRYFRSVNNRDIVPRVPFRGTPDLVTKFKDRQSDIDILPYRHGGNVIYFSDAGKAMMDPPLWYRRLDTLVVGFDKGELKAAAKETAGDHSMSSYLALHRKLLNVTEPGDPEQA